MTGFGKMRGCTEEGSSWIYIKEGFPHKVHYQIGLSQEIRTLPSQSAEDFWVGSLIYHRIVLHILHKHDDVV